LPLGDGEIFMKIHLAHFDEDVRTDVQCEYDPKVLELEFVDLRYVNKLAMEGTVEKGKNAVVFEGRLFSEIERICGRCLKSVAGYLDQPFKLYYETKENDDIDTTDELREVLILHHPLSFLCRENCRGLCSSCGTDLNEVRCDCVSKTQPPAESPFKVMQEKIKGEKKSGSS